MRTARRRLWTGLITAGASLVVLAATLSGLFSVAVHLVPGYRATVEGELSRLSGVPIKVGALALRWRGISPVLVLDEVRCANDSTASDGAALQADAPQLRRVELSIDLWRLLNRNWIPNELRLRGLRVVLQPTAGGGWTLAGVPPLGGGTQSGADVQAGLKIFQQLDRVRLEDARLSFKSSSGESLRSAAPQALSAMLTEPWTIERLSLRNQQDDHQLEAAVRTPAWLGQSLNLSADVQGALDQPQSLTAQWSAQLIGLSEVPGMAALLADGVKLKLHGARLDLGGEIRPGLVQTGEGHLHVEHLSTTRAAVELLHKDALAVRINWQIQGLGAMLDAGAAVPGSGQITVSDEAAVEGGQGMSAAPSPTRSATQNTAPNTAQSTAQHAVTTIAQSFTLSWAMAERATQTAGVASAAQNSQAQQASPEILITAPNIDLADYASWLTLLRGVPASAQSALHSLHGELHALRANWRPTTGADAVDGGAMPWAVQADLADIGVDPGADLPAVQGINGHLSVDPQGATLDLNTRDLLMNWHAQFGEPLQFSEVQGQLKVSTGAGAGAGAGATPNSSAAPTSDGLQISADPMHVVINDAVIDGRFAAQLPTTGAPIIDAALKLSARDLVALKPLLPNGMGPHTREWLLRAVEGGKLSHGELALRGALDQFPFINPQTGRWNLDLALSDMRLAFSSFWPALTQGKARVNFTGPGMTVDGQSARLGNAQVDALHAVVEDLHQADLHLDGHVQGDGADFYAVLRNSPLRTRLAGLLNNTEASGPVGVTLRIEVPLRDAQPQISAEGAIQLTDARLAMHAGMPPIDHLRGLLNFGANGVTGNGLSAQIDEALVEGKIVADPASRDGVIEARLNVSADVDNGLMHRYLPAPVRAHLQGQSAWLARFPLAGADGGHLSLSSDLRGITSSLPAPLAKRAEDALPVTVQVGGMVVRIALPAPRQPDGTLDSALDLALRSEADADGVAHVRALEARLGTGPLPQAEQPGITVLGSAKELDVPAWIEFAHQSALGGESGQRAATPPAVASLPTATSSQITASAALSTLPSASVVAPEPLSLRRIDVNAEQLRFGEFLTAPTHVVVEPWANVEGGGAEGGYQVHAEGEGVRGRLTWQRPAHGDSGGGVLNAALEALHLHRLPVTAAATAANAVSPDVAHASAPNEPGQWPVTNAEVEHFYVGESELGRLSLRTQAIADGQKIQTFHIQDGALDWDADGQWQRAAAGSSAELAVRFDSREFGEQLKGLGYADVLSGESAHVEGNFSWAPNPVGIDLALARGSVKVDMSRGALKAVEPGAGRLLGLLNLYALPRRLLLNFSDVTNKGLGFDSLAGDFTLGGGDATTENLEIRAPSVDLEVRGRVGLAARDYDEHITVNPQGMSTGVTVGAALLGGPAGAAIALIAQQLFDHPLDRLTQLNYRVTGSWDHPVIHHGTEVLHGDGVQEPPPVTIPLAPPDTAALSCMPVHAAYACFELLPDPS